MLCNRKASHSGNIEQTQKQHSRITTGNRREDLNASVMESVLKKVSFVNEEQQG